MNSTAIILAGGRSSRMGQNKALMLVDNKPMIAYIADQLSPHFDNIIIGANEIEKYAFLKYPVIPDKEENCGPLMGILSCLEKSKTELNFVVSCDIPHIDITFVEEMFQIAEKSDADIVIPVTGEERYEPLFAIYRKSVIQPAKEILEKGKRRIAVLFDKVNVEYIEMPDNSWYKNINTMKEYNKL